MHTGRKVIKPFEQTSFSGSQNFSLLRVDGKKGKRNGGERGIRTPGTVLPVRRFSKPFLSATQASLLSVFRTSEDIIMHFIKKSNQNYPMNPKKNVFCPVMILVRLRTYP